MSNNDKTDNQNEQQLQDATFEPKQNPYANYDWGAAQKKQEPNKLQQLRQMTAARYSERDTTMTNEGSARKKLMYRAEEFSESPLSSWDRLYYFLVKRPLISVPLYLLAGSMASLACTMFLKHNYGPVLFKWANIVLASKIATIGGIAYHSIVPDDEQTFETYKQ